MATDSGSGVLGKVCWLPLVLDLTSFTSLLLKVDHTDSLTGLMHQVDIVTSLTTIWVSLKAKGTAGRLKQRRKSKKEGESGGLM